MTRLQSSITQLDANLCVAMKTFVDLIKVHHQLALVKEIVLENRDGFKSRGFHGYVCEAFCWRLDLKETSEPQLSPRSQGWWFLPPSCSPGSKGAGLSPERVILSPCSLGVGG